MKVLKRQELNVMGKCPHCGSTLLIEKGDIWWHKDIDGGSSPCVTCGACGKGFDVEGWRGISKLY